MKRKRMICFVLGLVLCLGSLPALAEKIKIVDTVTGEIKIYDTRTKKLDKPGPGEEGVDPIKPDSSAKPRTSRMPNLLYSEDPVGDQNAVRAIKGDAYAIEGSNFALNGAARVQVQKNAKGKEEVFMVNKEGARIQSKGLVYVYMYVSPNVPRPFKVKVDGVYTQFAGVEGTWYVRFASEV